MIVFLDNFLTSWYEFTFWKIRSLVRFCFCKNRLIPSETDFDVKLYQLLFYWMTD
jgi:hypothetical protein